jgi:UDP-N-acetylglucosamine--N-acetylmuramyl-(pentapeptide) pyrophosphoryl-undecaprenol N-acetylglucosamine transferase
MRILITGAHLTPALAMIDYIQEKHSEDDLVFVGRLYSQEKLKQKAVEKDEVEKRGVKFISFEAVKFVNKGPIDALRSLVFFPTTVKEARSILKREKIDLFLSFGSYLAVPFAIAAKGLKIPVITHEQTIAMGKANQFIAGLSNEVAISYQETATYLKKDNFTLTGNPVRKRIFAKDLKKPSWFKTDKRKIILVMGGNQGSFVINKVVKNILSDLLKDFVVIHQCGRANEIKDYPKELKKYRSSLKKDLRENYFIKEWIAEEDLFWIYQHANFAISRAGANSVLELSLAPLPAILIPLANAFNDEQAKNAEMMENLGGAIVIEQKALNEAVLLETVGVLNRDYKEMRKSLSKHSFINNVEANIYSLISKYKN